MTQPRSQVLSESRRKGAVTVVFAGAAVAAGVASFPIVAAALGVPTLIAGYRWWKHRAENGIKF